MITFEHPSWAWVEMARINTHGELSWAEGREPPDEGVVFSTFAAGAEPDVWPALENKNAAPLGAAEWFMVFVSLLVLGWGWLRSVGSGEVA